MPSIGDTYLDWLGENGPSQRQLAGYLIGITMFLTGLLGALGTISTTTVTGVAVLLGATFLYHAG